MLSATRLAVRRQDNLSHCSVYESSSACYDVAFGRHHRLRRHSAQLGAQVLAHVFQASEGSSCVVNGSLYVREPFTKLFGAHSALPSCRRCWTRWFWRANSATACRTASVRVTRIEAGDTRFNSFTMSSSCTSCFAVNRIASCFDIPACIHCIPQQCKSGLLRL